MDITRFAIDKNRIFIAALLGVLFAGTSAYREMPRNEDPGFIIRVALVQTFFPGASPERVEMLVTDKLEKVIQEIPELDFVSSTSKVGVSIIYVNVRAEYTQMRPIWDNLRRKLEKAQEDLPESAIGPIVNDEFGDVFGTVVSITGDGFEYRELKQVADEVRDELLLIPEAAKVDIAGVQDERVFVEYDNTRLGEYGLSPLQLQQILQARNIILPGGDFSTPYEKVVLEPTGSFASVEDLRQSVINLPGRSDVIRLQDLVEITRGYVDPPTTRMRFNGEPALGLAVSLREGGNILDLGHAVRAVIERARAVYPVGIEFDTIQFQSDAVDKKIQDFVGNLLQAVAIVALVMLAFLGLRTGLIVSSLIPSTIVASFMVMSFFDIGLDQMSLASLIIALGMLVDNAIVMSESIMVRVQNGQDARTASIESARELRIPLLTSSLTTSAAFLPIFLAESDTGEYTAPLFKVVTITLLCSWVIALTLIPVLSVLFLKGRSAATDFGSPFYQGFRRGLLHALRRPYAALACIVAVFLIALQGLSFIPNIFFPPNDRPSLTIDVDLPAGSPIGRTDEILASVDDFIRSDLLADESRWSGVVNWASFIGEGAPKFLLSYNPEPSNPNYGFMLINATSREAVDDLIPPLQRFLFENFPDARSTVQPLPLGPPVTAPVAIRLSGRDGEVLFDIVDQVRRRVAETPGARDVTDDWGARSKKVIVNIDETRARLAGVSHQDIAISMQTYLTGLETTEYREGDQLIPVVLRSRSEDRLDPDSIGNINVYSQATGVSVPLGQVAEPELVWQPGQIMRRDRLRTVTVEAQLVPGVTAAQVNAAIQPWLEDFQASWPFGYSWEFGGEAETSGKANESIAAKLPIAFFLILLMLIAQFNSVRRPLIILLTIPLALIGVIAGLLIARSYFGFMTLLGIISLAGIVINNAIVLIDRIRIEGEENGLDPHSAVVTSVQQRLRPILLTTATTVGGLIPLWLGGGPMWEPMAVTIIFGLLFATVLTLIVVPVLYSLFFSVRFDDETVSRVFAACC